MKAAGPSQGAGPNMATRGQHGSSRRQWPPQAQQPLPTSTWPQAHSTQPRLTLYCLRGSRAPDRPGSNNLSAEHSWGPPRRPGRWFRSPSTQPRAGQRVLRWGWYEGGGRGPGTEGAAEPQRDSHGADRAGAAAGSTGTAHPTPWPRAGGGTEARRAEAARTAAPRARSSLHDAALGLVRVGLFEAQSLLGPVFLQVGELLAVDGPPALPGRRGQKGHWAAWPACPWPVGLGWPTRPAEPPVLTRAAGQQGVGKGGYGRPALALAASPSGHHRPGRECECMLTPVPTCAWCACDGLCPRVCVGLGPALLSTLQHTCSTQVHPRVVTAWEGREGTAVL